LFDPLTSSLSDPKYNEFRNKNSIHGGDNVSYFSTFEMKDKAQKLLETLILKPFIDFLRILVKAKADPSAKVDKLEFYR
jgi:hypothetical protein